MRRRRKKAESPLRFSKKVVIAMFLCMLAFTVAMTVTYGITGGIPDALVEPFFGFFKVEGGALGVIKIAELIRKQTVQDKQNDKEEPIRTSTGNKN